jgi:hypothetical protein
MYGGWWLGGIRRRPLPIVESPEQSNLQINPLMFAAILCTIIGVGVHFVFYEQWDLSGYLLDLEKLWITAAILWIQIHYLAPRFRPTAIFGFLVAISPALDRFIVYGQRGDTFRLAALVTLFYLIRRKRPTKIVFITAAVVLGLTLATLQMTRDLVASGESTNRITALVKVIPHFFDQAERKIDPGDEDVFGAASVKIIRETGEYGYGRTLTIGLFAHLLPRALFPDKDEWTYFHGQTPKIGSWGSARSGFALGFMEMGWFCWLIWMIYGFIYRRMWDRAIQGGDIRYQALVVGVSIAVLYGISQELLTAEINVLYVIVPLLLIYRLARLPKPELALLPLPA